VAASANPSFPLFSPDYCIIYETVSNHATNGFYSVGSEISPWIFFSLAPNCAFNSVLIHSSRIWFISRSSFGGGPARFASRKVIGLDTIRTRARTDFSALRAGIVEPGLFVRRHFEGIADNGACRPAVLYAQIGARPERLLRILPPPHRAFCILAVLGTRSHFPTFRQSTWSNTNDNVTVGAYTRCPKLPSRIRQGQVPITANRTACLPATLR